MHFWMRLAWFVALGPFLIAATPSSISRNDAAALIEAERQWGQAFVSGDVATVQRLVADDFRGVETNGSIYGKADVIAWVKALPHGTSDVVVDPVVRIYGNAAVVQAHEYEVGPAPDARPAERVFTDTWVKRGGVWRIVAAEDVDPGLPTKQQFQTEISAIRAAREATNRAIAAHSLEALLPVFAEDAVFTWADGSHSVGRQALASGFNEDFRDPNFIKYVRTPVSISVSDSGVRALERGRWTALKKNKVYGGDYVAHWMRGAKGWRIVGELYVKLYCSRGGCER